MACKERNRAFNCLNAQVEFRRLNARFDAPDT
jgi:hypothetical protein